MSNYKFKNIVSGKSSIQNLIGNQQIISVSEERLEKVEMDNLQLRNQLLGINGKIERIMNTVLPNTVDKLLDSRIDEICNEKGSQALFLMERQATKSHTNLDSTSITILLHNRASLILTSEAIGSRFNALQNLRYIH